MEYKNMSCQHYDKIYMLQIRKNDSNIYETRSLVIDRMRSIVKRHLLFRKYNFHLYEFSGHQIKHPSF